MRSLVLAVLCALPVLSACQLQSGPAAVEPGTYNALASSIGSRAPSAQLQVTGDAVIVRSGGQTQTAAFAERSAEFLLCPPDGRGTGTVLDSTITLNGETFVRPMLFGDCATTQPPRLTLVDLASQTPPEQSTTLPFGRWAEFCRNGEADCPNP